MLQHNKKTEQRVVVYSAGGLSRIGEVPFLAVGITPIKTNITLWMSNSYHYDNVVGSLRRSAKISKTRTFVIEQRGIGARKWKRVRLLSIVVKKITATRDDIVIDGKVVRDVDYQKVITKKNTKIRRGQQK